MSRLALNTAPELTCISSLSDSSFDGVYHAVQSFLGSKHNPQSFSWARITLITMLFAHFIMLLLALAVIFLRLPTRKFTLGSITRHGVLRPNATGCVTICCILFDIFAIIGLAMQLAIDCGISNPEAKAHIPGIKYVIIWFGVWCFCWSTACQYICARWDPPWKLGANDRALNVVPFPVIVMLNVTFVGVAFISITISATIFTLSNQRYIDLIRAIDNLGPKLISLKIKSNNSSTLVGVNLPMEPLHELDHLIYNFSHWLKIRILTCLGLNSCLLFVYTPFIFFTYIQLKRFMQFAPKEWAESKNGPQKHQPAQKKGFKIDCKKEMRSLLITAATIFSVFLVEWPLLVWEFIHISAGHCKSDEGLVMREMASDVIVSIIGNIIIGFTLAQTIRIIQPKPWDSWSFRRRKIPSNHEQDQKPQNYNNRDIENCKDEEDFQQTNSQMKKKISNLIKGKSKSDIKNKNNNSLAPVRELTVSVLQLTQSEASEPLEQPNFDVLQSWAQRRNERNEVLRHHLHLSPTNQENRRESDEKALEMDLLKGEELYD